MPFALLAEFVPEKRYLAILTIYLLSHLVNHNGGGGGLGRLLPLWRIDKARVVRFRCLVREECCPLCKCLRAYLY